ncbi:hypothetical protein [Streptomyces sp. MP131-18]|uniref:hypothetical protein n=1 Tax=Streptomyces sp. MP131-18 TaxID=1857892 RepID=UPI00209B10B1|nr:hypothetical protein [Streptomyces sp. MP131-18]
MIDDLGSAELWGLARDTAMTQDDLSWGAAAVLTEADPGAGDLLDELTAHTLTQEVAERTSIRSSSSVSGKPRASLGSTTGMFTTVQGRQVDPTNLTRTATTHLHKAGLHRIRFHAHAVGHLPGPEAARHTAQRRTSDRCPKRGTDGPGGAGRVGPCWSARSG